MDGHEELCATFYNTLTAAYQRLERVWESIGIKEEPLQERRNTVIVHLHNLIDEIITEEEDLYTRMQENVEKYQVEVADVCRELECSQYQLDANLTIIQKEKVLKNCLKELEKEKETRMREVESLKSEDQEMCDRLLTTPYYIPSGSVPTSSQMTELRHHVNTSKQEVTKRHERFLTAKYNISDLLRDLEKEASTSFESDVLYESEEAFVLSSSNMSLLEGLLTELETEKRDAESTYNTLMDSITTLWDRLGEPADDRRAFCDANVGYTHRTISKLRTELMRCEQLKLLNMQTFIKTIRSELVEWWNKCFYGVEQRENFTHFYSEDCTEELLTIHEEEVETLKNLYRTAEDVYKKLEHRQVVFQSIKDFERMQNSDDPNRYNNRGGRLNALLQKHSKMKKQLPMIENELKYSVIAWEKNHGPFLVDGVSYEAYVVNESERWKDELNEGKRMRQLQKAKIQEQEMTFGSTPTKRRLCSSSTPTKLAGTAKKQRLQDTPTSTTPRNLLTSTFSSHFGLPPTGKTPSTLNKTTPKPRRSRRLATSRRILGPRNPNESSHLSNLSIVSDARSWPNMSLASAGSYNDFASGLDKKPTTNARTKAFRP